MTRDNTEALRVSACRHCQVYSEKKPNVGLFKFQNAFPWLSAEML
jgi:hypothetical protein